MWSLRGRFCPRRYFDDRSSFVRMQVMRIGNVGMYVPNGFMAMSMAMLADWFILMSVQMVAVVMSVGMFVLGGFMNMLMSM